VISISENSATLAVDESQQQNLEEAREIVNELLPLAIGAVGAGLSAVDAYRAYKDYKAGKIDKTDLAKQVGSNVALGLVGGGAAKIGQAVARGAKAGVQAIKKRVAPAKADAPTKKKSTKKSRRDRDFDYNTPQNVPDTDLTGTIRRIAQFENTDYVVTFPLTETVNLDLTESRSRIWTLKVW
jgi:hypothetical protein